MGTPDEDERSDDGTVEEDGGHDPAGHAEHFLSRLDRVQTGEVELALSLYNDVALLEEILLRARVPEQAPRVAIALKDGGAGPHIVVTRDARFVTCLGEGMKTGELPIIARGQLDAFAHHVESLRTKIALSRQLFRGRSPVLPLFDRVFTAGPALTQEEFLAASGWISMVRMPMLRRLTGMLQTHVALVDRARLATRLTPKNTPLLRQLWQNMWGAGHLTMLLASEARGICERLAALPAPSGEDLMQVPVAAAYVLGTAGAIGLTLRAAYFAARCGKPVAGRHKKLMLEMTRPDDLLVGFALQGCTAHRHERLRAEIRKALSASTANRTLNANAPAEREARIRAFLHKHHAAYCAAIDRGFEDPEAATRRTRDLGRVVAWSLGQADPTSPFRFDSYADLPDAVALALIATSAAHPFHRADVLLDALPWIARVEPGDFYLPAKFARGVGTRADLSMVLGYLAEQRDLPANRPKSAPAAKVGRNDPCPCGSGKKHKRCCG